jgi:hypothetical protein
MVSPGGRDISGSRSTTDRRQDNRAGVKGHKLVRDPGLPTMNPDVSPAGMVVRSSIPSPFFMSICVFAGALGVVVRCAREPELRDAFSGVTARPPRGYVRSGGDDLRHLKQHRGPGLGRSRRLGTSRGGRETLLRHLGFGCWRLSGEIARESASWLRIHSVVKGSSPFCPLGTRYGIW